MRPSQVGNYELIRLLGVGGMAETYEAVRHGPAGFSQRVCLKRMLGHSLELESAVELFLDEARLSALLRCGSIAQVIDFGEADGSYYIALELVEGENLETLLRSRAASGRTFSWPVVTYLAAELLSALDYAHTLSHEGAPLGIVHRDVSPSNVMVSVRGEVKLTDFGIAKARGRKHRTRSGHTKGKLAYMSPEQAHGAELDGRSDLFSLGIVLYELMTLRHPFEATTEIELLRNIVEAKFVPLEKLVPDAPRELRLLVERLLRPEPRGRIASAAQALSGLTFPASPYLVQAELAAIVADHQQGRGSEGRERRPSSRPPTATLELASTDPAGASRSPADVGYSAAHGTAGERASWRRRRWLWAVALAGLLVAAASSLLIFRESGPEPVATPSAAPAAPTPAPVRPAVQAGTDEAASAAPLPTPSPPQAPGPDASTPERRAAPTGREPVRRKREPVVTPAKEPNDKSRSGVKVTPEEFL